MDKQQVETLLYTFWLYSLTTLREYLAEAENKTDVNSFLKEAWRAAGEVIERPDYSEKAIHLMHPTGGAAFGEPKEAKWLHDIMEACAKEVCAPFCPPGFVPWPENGKDNPIFGEIE